MSKPKYPGPRPSIARPRSVGPTALVAALAALSLLPGCAGGDSVSAHLRAANEAIANDAFDAASLQLTNALQAEPTNADTRALLAQVALIAGRASVTERQARAVARLDNDPQRGKALLCEALLARGQFETLLREFIEDESVTARTCRGRALLKLGEVADAILQFNNVLDSAPGLIRAQLGLAEAEQAQGQYTQAERRLRNVIAREPLHIGAQRQLAALLVQLNRLDEAALTLRDAIALPRDLDTHPDWLEARVVLAEVTWRQGDKRKAVVELETLLDEYPSHPLPKYLRALLAYEDGDYRLSREFLRNVLNLVPGHEASEKLSTAADLAQGQFGSAQLPFIEGEKNWADDPLMTELQSRIYLGMGNAGEAVASMKSLEEANWTGSAQRHLARSLTLAGRFEEAQSQYDVLTASQPDDLAIAIRSVANLLHQGNLIAADRAMSGWPVNDRTQNARSSLRLLRFLRAGDLRRAEELAKRRRRDDARDLTALLALAESSERQGRRDDAVRWLELAVERNPEAVEPRMLLANYAARQGDHRQMQDMADAILSQQPHNADALAVRGEASLLRGDSYAAIDTLREANRVSPSSTRVAVSLVRAQLASGDFWQARRDIKGALLRDALSPQAIAGLAIEEHRRGNAEQARALSDDLVGLDRSRTVGLAL
ncbi:MAG: tetratricopeptide repeat protein, partial [Pseudomonadota bacterium]